MRTLTIVAAMAGLGACLAADGPTYAERLGWAGGTRVLILHSDDAGMSRESNLGTVEAMTDGIVTSTSVMMPCPWVPDLLHRLKPHPQLDVGLHLTLTAEWKGFRWGPLAGKAAVPGLVDKEGCLWHSVNDVVTHAKPEEIEQEIRAQIARAEAAGLRPTHLDSHMGTLFADDRFFAIYVKVAIEKRIPPFVPAAELLRRTKGDTLRRLFATQVLTSIWNARLPVIDHYFSMTGEWGASEKKAGYRQFAERLQPGITMVIVHCTKPSPHFGTISGSGRARAEDLRTAKDPQLAAVLKAQGIVLTTWRELTRRRARLGAGVQD